MSKMLSFDNRLLVNVNINTCSVKQTANSLTDLIRRLDDNSKIDQLLLAVKCIDLTTLSGDDTYVNVERLCSRSVNPLRVNIIDGIQTKLNRTDIRGVKTAAVCVYPSRVTDCANAFNKLNDHSVKIASVATGFPSGQYSLKTRLSEIEFALECGANEIDVVIDRSLALDANWEAIFGEVRLMRQLCDTRDAHLKVILSTGELWSLDNVYKASMTCMLAGAHFIKTSTGKETINATLPVGVVMTRAIWDFFNLTGIRVGFKAAGGLRTSDDALEWMALIKTQLGDQWLAPDLFRIGASSLLNQLEQQVFQIAFARKPFHYELSL